MNRRGVLGSVAERVSQDREPASVEPSRAPSIVKHCWVDGACRRLPGLLLEWRRTASGYQGRVVHPVEEHGIGWVVVEEWLPAGRLAKSGTDPPAEPQPDGLIRVPTTAPPCPSVSDGSRLVMTGAQPPADHE